MNLKRVEKKYLNSQFILTILIAVCLNFLFVLQARAEDQGSQVYNIPPGSMASVLNKFADQNGLTLVYDSALVKGLRSPGVSGNFSREEALRQLLKGAGITYQFTGDKNVTLVKMLTKAIELSPINVVEQDTLGYMSKRAISASRSGALARDVPQNIEVYNQNILKDTRSNNIGEVLRLSPGAISDGGSMASFGDSVLFRGFSGTFVVNGQRGGTGFNHARDTQNVERVEVLKGPGSVMYGQMEPGATVNIVTKQPLDYFFAEAGVQIASFKEHRLFGDVSAPLTENKKVKFRFNAVYEDKESFIEFWDREHIFVAPVISVDFTPDTRFTAEYTFSQDRFSTFYNGQPASGLVLDNINGQYNPGVQIAEPDFFGTLRSNHNVMSRLEHRFNDWLVARANFSWTRSFRKFQEVFPSSFATDQRTLSRSAFISTGDTGNDFFYLVDVTANFNTGPIKHDFLFGADYRRQTGDFNTVGATIGSLDLFNPVYGLSSLADGPTRKFLQTINNYGVFLQDRIAILDNLKLVGGFRHAYLDQNTSFAPVGGELAPNDRTDRSWTSQAGIVYQPWEPVSLFFNRMESFVPQGGTTQGGTPFDPETGIQYEGGIKSTFLDGRATFNISYFHITKENVATTDPANPSFSIAVGELVSKGMEASLQSQPLDNLNLIASFGYTDTEITKDNDGNQGNTFRNIPRYTVALQGRYDFEGGLLDKFSVNGNLTHIPRRQANNANTFKLPSYTRVDLGWIYQPLPKWDVSFWVENLADQQIFATAFSETVFLENPRTFHGQVKYRF